MTERDAGRQGPVSFAGLIGSILGMLSLAAGVVHLSAAPEHREHRLIFVFFVGLACVQLLWAGMIVNRPGRRLLLAGAGLNAAVLGIWLASRTTGLPLVPGASAPEELGMKDTVCGLFEVVLVAGVALLFVMPEAARKAKVQADTGIRGIGAVAVVLMLLTVPASLAAHTHADSHDHVDAALAAAEGSPHTHARKAAAGTPDAHTHDDGEGAATANEAVADTSTHTDHAHTASASATKASSGAGDAHVHDGGSTDGTHDGGGAAGGHSHAADAGCRPTPAQQAAADRLIADTKAALVRWTDQGRALADGYVPYPPVPAGWAQHYVNFSSLDDGRVLDPRRPESLLYAQTDQGYRPISALYILPHAWSPIPDVGGCLTHWHGHEELFLSRPGEKGSPPMLHVFTVPMAGGPFAHEPDPRSVRDLWMPFRVLINPWWKDGCGGAPALPLDPYQAVPSCQTQH